MIYKPGITQEHVDKSGKRDLLLLLHTQTHPNQTKRDLLQRQKRHTHTQGITPMEAYIYTGHHPKTRKRAHARPGAQRYLPASLVSPPHCVTSLTSAQSPLYVSMCVSHVCLCVCMKACMCACMYICLSIYVYMYIYTHVCIYVCVRVCVCLCTHTHTHTHTYLHTYTHIYRLHLT